MYKEVLDIINVICIISFIVCVIGVAGCLYMLKRNDSVYDFCCRILKSDFEKYKKLPSYDDMMYKYWYEWDFDKFLIIGNKK